MARPPQMTLKREDFAAVKEEWMDRLIRSLNVFAKQATGALRNGLTMQENMDAFWKTVTVTKRAPDASHADEPLVIMQNDLANKARPKGVSVVACLDKTDTPDVPTSVGSPAWRMEGSGIAIMGMSGLTDDHKYEVTFLVFGG